MKNPHYIEGSVHKSHGEWIDVVMKSSWFRHEPTCQGILPTPHKKVGIDFSTKKAILCQAAREAKRSFAGIVHKRKEMGYGNSKASL